MTPHKPALLDRLHPAARHLLLAVLPVVLAWASADLIPFLQGRFPAWAAIWVTVQQALLWATPLTRQYGAGATR